jgi:hypothetical protein
MFSTALDLLFYGSGLLLAGVCLLSGIFLAIAGYYFINDLIK